MNDLFIFSVICGITEDTQQYHIIRAALEAVCFQTRDILEAMVKDSGTKLSTLQVDGGMTVNDLLMQLQADITGIHVGECNSKKKKINKIIIKNTLEKIN